GYQTSYVDSWSFGLQRAVGKNMSVEARYIGNEAHALAGTVNYNEVDIYNNSFGGSQNFLSEFVAAQKNLAFNVANNRGATFAYTGAGTTPLPIFLASYSGLAGCVTVSTCTGASDTTKYNSTQWTNTAIIGSLSQLSPGIGTFASFGTTNG